jgi:Flp pilus assembly CpaF family ATPase
VNEEEFDLLVADIRRQWGDRFPVPVRDENPTDREQRERSTREVLEHVVMPELSHQRLLARVAPLSGAEHDAVIDLVVSEIFGLPRLLTVLRDPYVTDVLVFGADPVRVERSDGTRQLLSPLV